MNPPTRCCFLGLNLCGGGAERHMLQLLNHWPDSSWQFNLILLARQGVWFDEIPQTVQLHTLSSRMPVNGLQQLVWAMQMVPRFRAALQNGYDILLTFLWLPTLVASLALRGLAVPPPLVWSIQSDLEQAFRLRRTGTLRRWLMANVALPQVNHCIAITPGLSVRVQQLLHIETDRISVIPNSIDYARIKDLLAQPAHIPPKCASIRIVSVGRLHPQKSMDILLQAIAIIYAKGLSIECFIVGEGEEQARLQALAADLDIADVIHFVGYSANPYAWMHSADLFVLASSWEPFGIVLAEAMALGLPIITTATDGALALIESEAEGLVVPPGNPPRLAEAILSLMEYPHLRKWFGDQARRKAHHFDAPTIARQYQVLLEQLLPGAVSEKSQNRPRHDY